MWPVEKSSIRLIVVENGLKGLSMPLEKVLIVNVVEVFFTFHRISEQSIWKPAERPRPGLEIHARYIDYNSLIWTNNLVVKHLKRFS